MPPPPSATYQCLRHTIAERMRMSHVYQPLMLTERLGRQRLDASREQRLDQGPGAHPCLRPLRVLRGGLLPGRSRTRGHWRWATAPRNHGGPTTSASFRPFASGAMPASAMLVANARGVHRLPWSGGQIGQARSGLRVLRAGGLRLGAAGERTGAVHRRCLPGDAGPHPGDPAAPWGRRFGAASA